MNEYDLIESFQAGDEFAFVGIYNRYKGPVYSFCYKMLLNRDSAQDVMQETFLRVYENRDRLLKTSAFKSWLFTIARNQCLNAIRRGGRQVGLSQEASERLPAPDTPFTQMEKSEQTRFISSLFIRQILILSENDDFSIIRFELF